MSGSLTATVDAQSHARSPERAVTVTGHPPVVDVDSAARESRSAATSSGPSPPLAATTRSSCSSPAWSPPSNDVVTGTATTAFPDPRRPEQRRAAAARRLDRRQSAEPAIRRPATWSTSAHAQEVTFTDAGGLGETETAGLVMNIVPKSRRQLDARLALRQRDRRAAPVRQPDTGAEGPGRHRRRARSRKVYDVSGTLGGPIAQGSRVVFRHRAQRRQHDGQHERVLQPQRRRPGEVAVCARCRAGARTRTACSRTPARASRGR